MHESEKWKWRRSVVSEPTLSDPKDCSPPGSSVHGIFQARALEGAATAFCTDSTSIQFQNIFITPKGDDDTFKKASFRTSVKVQGIGICLPVRGTGGWSLAQEDSTCCGTAQSMRPNSWGCAPQQEKPPQWEARAQQRGPSATKNKNNKKINKILKK